MSLEIFGNQTIPHVKQPPESELCFAALVSAVTGHSVEEASEALIAANLSEFDGTTSPPFEPAQVSFEKDSITLEPVVGPFDLAEAEDGPNAVLQKIQDQLEHGKPTALLYKKEPASTSYHWVLFSSYARDSNGVLSLRLIDPLRDREIAVTPRRVEAMIERSIEHLGVFACSFKVNQPQTKAA